MKTKIITVICAVIMSAAGITPVRAHESNTTAMAADAIVGRPLYFAATVVGSVIFVVSLPVAATSGSIASAAHTLVVNPARDTFVRPLGDFSYPNDTANGSVTAKRGTAKKAATQAAAHDLTQR